jgi:hypothetical protein
VVNRIAMDRSENSPELTYASEILLRLAPPQRPEDRLMLAILLDGVALLREHATGLCPHAPRLVSTTVRWFAVADEEWPLSFVNVCRTLGLDPPVLRAGLQRELTDLGAVALLDPRRPSVVPLRAVAPAAPAARRRHATSSQG